MLLQQKDLITEIGEEVIVRFNLHDLKLMQHQEKAKISPFWKWIGIWPTIFFCKGEVSTIEWGLVSLLPGSLKTVEYDLIWKLGLCIVP